MYIWKKQVSGAISLETLSSLKQYKHIFTLESGSQKMVNSISTKGFFSTVTPILKSETSIPVMLKLCEIFMIPIMCYRCEIWGFEDIEKVEFIFSMFRSQHQPWQSEERTTSSSSVVERKTAKILGQTFFRGYPTPTKRRSKSLHSQCN